LLSSAKDRGRWAGSSGDALGLSCGMAVLRLRAGLLEVLWRCPGRVECRCRNRAAGAGGCRNCLPEHTLVF
jgi:hypothetical protein